VTADAVQ